MPQAHVQNNFRHYQLFTSVQLFSMDDDDNFDLYCAICGGPHAAVKVRTDSADENQDGYNPNVIQQQDVEWSKQLHILGRVQLSRLDFTCLAPVLPRAGEEWMSSPETIVFFFGVRLDRLCAYSPTEGLVFPFHWPCYEILARYITGHPDPKTLDKGALFRSFARVLRQYEGLDLDYGDARIAQDQYWKSIPGMEYTVVNPAPRQELKRQVMDLIIGGQFESKPLKLIPRPEAESNPLQALPETLLYEVIQSLDNESLLNLCHASWSTFLMLRDNQSFWKSRLLGHMSYFFELLEIVCGSSASLGSRDLRRILQWANTASKPRPGITGPLLPVANRRRIWNVCEQIQSLYSREPIQGPMQTSDLEQSSFCNKMHSVGYPGAAKRDVRDSVWLRSWDDLYRRWTLEIFWNVSWTLSGIGVKFDKEETRLFGYKPREKGSWRTAGSFGPDVWIKGFIFHIIYRPNIIPDYASVKGITVYLTDGSQRSYGQADAGLARMPIFIAPEMTLLGIRGVLWESDRESASPEIVTFGLLQLPSNGCDKPNPRPEPKPCEGLSWKGETLGLDQLIHGSDGMKLVRFRREANVDIRYRSLISMHTLILAHDVSGLSTIRSISANVVPVKVWLAPEEMHIFNYRVCNLRVSTDDGQRLLREVDDDGTPWSEDCWNDFEVDGPGGEVIQEISIFHGRHTSMVGNALRLRTNRDRTVLWGISVLADDQGLPSGTRHITRDEINEVTIKAEDGYDIVGITMACGRVAKSHYGEKQEGPWTEEEYEKRKQSSLHSSMSSVGLLTRKDDLRTSQSYPLPWLGSRPARSESLITPLGNSPSLACIDMDNHGENPCAARPMVSPAVGPSSQPEQLERINDLNQIIQLARRTFTFIDEHHPEWPTQLWQLGAPLYRRYRMTGDFSNLEESIPLLGLQLGDSYYHTLEVADLDEAIPLLRESIINQISVHRAMRLGNLGIAIKERYLRVGAEDDFQEACEVLKETVRILPDEHYDTRPMWLEALADLQLAAVVYELYYWTGDYAQLKESVELEVDALAATPEEDPQRLIRLHNAQRRMHDTYCKTGDLGHLEATIQLGRKFLEEAPEDHHYRSAQMNNLSVNMSYKYDVLGKLSDLEEAILLGREAFAVMSEDPQDWQSYVNLGNLAANLMSRYRTTGALMDLEEAISFNRRVLEAVPDDPSLRSFYMHNLASSLRSKYQRSGGLKNLEEAINLSKKTIELTKEGHDNLPLYLDSVAVGLGHRFSKLQRTEDLEEGIRLARQAIAISRDRYAGEVGISRYNKLATLLEKKFENGGALAEIDEAIEITKMAVSLTSPEDPAQGDFLTTLGGHHIARYNRTMEEDEEQEDITSALRFYREAVNQPSGLTRRRISAAATALQLCFKLEEVAYELGRVATELIPGLSLRSLETSDRQYLMAEAIGVASHTAAAALIIGKTPLHALSLLELGRGMADEFVRLRDELDTKAVFEISKIEEDHASVLNTRGHRRHDAGRAFEALLVDIRQLPGFDNFLGPLTDQEMRSASENGPIAVINVSAIGCHAILVQVDQVRFVSLDGVSNWDIIKRAMTGDLGSLQTLEWLWDTITGPVLYALGFAGPPSGDKWPHVWWIPTGPLSKFPLHASGRHRKGSSETVMDRVMSSYSPSIKALIHGRRRRFQHSVASTQEEALLVAMQHTPGHSDLPYAAREVAAINDVCDSMSFKAVEPGCSKKDVVARLKGCKIFHFAGHAYTDIVDPSKSHLCLDDKDDPLTVADLLDMNLHQYSPFLAYLSACGTGRVQDDRFIDESIHLISACQLAGFRHVIGTMWQVKDEYCADIARITYESLRDGGVTDETVCRALHNATKTLRDRWIDGRDQDVFELSVLDRELKERSATVNQTLKDNEGAREDRDMVACDDDRDRRVADWVPYVHFGV
ncbi:hypothetical protein NM208_g165 [Fusarium decemcellulare]|uniref:Uncharacterized protein n=1 Tax=Fusarium decemcellulare TaxID=57161 RepID=A0ACC1T126_9HYPO|nr:hypothetical protein NM208_g165 [Fusarium decemcellulare]